MKIQILLVSLIAMILLVPLASKAQEDDNNNQMCIGSIPKNFFGNQDCYECRKTTSKIGFGTGTAMTALKLLGMFEAFCCNDRTCGESCSVAWGMPAINQCCESRSLCCANSVCLSTTILVGVGAATGICAWNPLCTQEGWNPKLKCLKKEKYHPQRLDMQMNEDENNNQNF